MKKVILFDLAHQNLPLFLIQSILGEDENGDLILIASRMENPGQTPEEVAQRFSLASPKMSPKMIHTQFASDIYFWKLPLSQVTKDNIISTSEIDGPEIQAYKEALSLDITEEGLLLNMMNDFPKVNPYFLGYPSKFAYIAINSTQLLKGEEYSKLRFDKMLKLDLFDLLKNKESYLSLGHNEDGFKEITNLGENQLLEFETQGPSNCISLSFGGEISFINQSNEVSINSNPGNEDSGYLIHIIYDDGTSEYDIAESRAPNCQARVYDASSVREIGRWNLPIRVASGAHSLWIPGEEIDS